MQLHIFLHLESKFCHFLTIIQCDGDRPIAFEKNPFLNKPNMICYSILNVLFNAMGHICLYRLIQTTSFSLTLLFWRRLAREHNLDNFPDLVFARF